MDACPPVGVYWGVDDGVWCDLLAEEPHYRLPYEIKSRGLLKHLVRPNLHLGMNRTERPVA